MIKIDLSGNYVIRIHLVYHANPYLIIPSLVNTHDNIGDSIRSFENLIIEANHFLDTLQIINQTPDPNDFEPIENKKTKWHPPEEHRAASFTAEAK